MPAPVIIPARQTPLAPGVGLPSLLPTLSRFGPVARNEGKTQSTLVPMAAWVDNLVLPAGQAQLYLLPIGTDGSTGNQIAAHFFRLNTTGALWLNAYGEAAVPTANVTTGGGSVYVPAVPGTYFFLLPAQGQLSPPPNFSLLAPGGAIVSIEAWW